MGVGFLPPEQIRAQIEAGSLKQLKLIKPVEPQQLNIAWKVINKGKALKALAACIENEFN